MGDWGGGSAAEFVDGLSYLNTNIEDFPTCCLRTGN